MLTSFEIIEEEKFIVQPIKLGMHEIIVKEGEFIDSNDINLMKKINLQLSDNRPYVLLVDSKEFSSISKDARELSASKEMAKVTYAKALLVHSLAHKLVGNFYINVNKPFIKTKIFTDRQKALNWLEQQHEKLNEKN